MSRERALAHLARWGREGDAVFTERPTFTVAQAAAEFGVGEERIAKTLAVYNAAGDGAHIVVTAGDTRLDNKKFRAAFGWKPHMLRGDDTERLTGHAPGGVCPFGLPDGVAVYLDVSLRPFDLVYPAVGTGNSAIPLRLSELEEYAGAAGWVDACS